jgi:molybdopterin converting factor small subunit
MKSTEFNEADLTPITINIFYDSQLQRITGLSEEKAVVNNGCPFFFLLESVFMTHRDIQRKYPPGILVFSLNGKIPNPNTQLKDGDIVSFIVQEFEQ